MKTPILLNWLVAVTGVWQVLSPFILGYSATTVAMWNAIAVGVVLIVLGAWAALYKNITVDRTLDWINAVVGLWLIVSIFALGFSTMAAIFWNSLIVGAVVIVLSVWAALTFGKEVSLQA